MARRDFCLTTKLRSCNRSHSYQQFIWWCTGGYRSDHRLDAIEARVAWHPSSHDTRTEDETQITGVA